MTSDFMAHVMQKPFFCAIAPVCLRARRETAPNVSQRSRSRTDVRHGKEGKASAAQLADGCACPSRKRTSGGVWSRTWRAELRKHVLPRFCNPAPTGCLRAQPTEVSMGGKPPAEEDAVRRSAVGESVEEGARTALEVEAMGEPLVDGLPFGVCVGCRCA